MEKRGERPRFFASLFSTQVQVSCVGFKIVTFFICHCEVPLCGAVAISRKGTALFNKVSVPGDSHASLGMTECFARNEISIF